MASIVEWQSLRMQEYRYTLLVGIARFFELFGIRRPMRYEAPIIPGDYETAIHSANAEEFLAPYLAKAAHRPPIMGGSSEATTPGVPPVS
jgi:hypothetical protein